MHKIEYEVNLYFPLAKDNLFWSVLRYPKWLIEHSQWIGKRVKTSNIEGILQGIQITNEDYYYMILTDDKKLELDTAVAGLSLVKETEK